MSPASEPINPTDSVTSQIDTIRPLVVTVWWSPEPRVSSAKSASRMTLAPEGRGGRRGRRCACAGRLVGVAYSRVAHAKKSATDTTGLP